MKSLSRVRLFDTPLIVAYQAPPSMVFSRQEYWSGLPFPSPAPDPALPQSPSFSLKILLPSTPGSQWMVGRTMAERPGLSLWSSLQVVQVHPELALLLPSSVTSHRPTVSARFLLHLVWQGGLEFPPFCTPTIESQASPIPAGIRSSLPLSALKSAAPTDLKTYRQRCDNSQH